MTTKKTHTNKTILRVLLAAAAVLILCGAATGAAGADRIWIEKTELSVGEVTNLHIESSLPMDSGGIVPHIKSCPPYLTVGSIHLTPDLVYEVAVEVTAIAIGGSGHISAYLGADPEGGYLETDEITVHPYTVTFYDTDGTTEIGTQKITEISQDSSSTVVPLKALSEIKPEGIPLFLGWEDKDHPGVYYTDRQALTLTNDSPVLNLKAVAADNVSVISGTKTIISNGYYRLAPEPEDSDTVNGTITVGDGTTPVLAVLDLNGKTLNAEQKGSAVTIKGVYNKASALTLVDLVGGGKITGGYAQNGGGIWVDYDAALTMFDGTISGNTACDEEAVVESMAEANGGGVYNESRSTFTMYGGQIAGNNVICREGITGTNSGGGVYNCGTFMMFGGTIAGNSTSGMGYGGGVFLQSGVFGMTGGKIIGNSAATFGGGVYYKHTDSTNISGDAVVTDNAALAGPNVCLGEYTSGNLTITGHFTGRMLITCDSSEPFGTAADGITDAPGIIFDGEGGPRHVKIDSDSRKLTWEEDTAADVTLISLNPATGGLSPVIAAFKDADTSFSLVPPKNGDCRFTGWYTEESDGIQLIDTDGRLITSAETGTYVNGDGTWGYTGSSLTLYAHWTSADTTITLNPNDGSGAEQTVEAYNNVTEGFSTILNPTRIGYMFTGWYTAETGGTKVIDTDGRLVQGVSGYTTADGKWSCPESAVTFYAGWRAADTAILLHLKDGSGTALHVYAYAGVTTSFTITWPERTGYTFTGWYTAETGGTKVIDTDGKLVPDVSGYTDQNGIWICTEVPTLSLYAHWISKTPGEYTVTFYDTDGTTKIGTQQITDIPQDGSSTVVPLKALSEIKQGGIPLFLGWEDKDHPGVYYTDRQALTLTKDSPVLNLKAVAADTVSVISGTETIISNGYYELTPEPESGDTVNGTITVGDGTTPVLAVLDLNGKTLNAKQTGSAVTIKGVNNKASALTLIDSSANGTGKITGGKSPDGSGVAIEGGGFTMMNGSITGNGGGFAAISSHGGGVYVSEIGTFTMYGGTIMDNTITAVTSESSFLSASGGGVYTIGTFLMADGKISGNKVAYTGDYSGGVEGGGVFVREGTFLMSGGCITGNSSAQYYGGVCFGGVYVSSWSNANITVTGDATIQGNIGSDVYVKVISSECQEKVNLTGALTGTVLVYSNDSLIGTAAPGASGENHIINENTGYFGTRTDDNQLTWSSTPFSGTIITLDRNGGDEGISRVAAFKDATKSFPIVPPKNGDRRFTGWYTEKSGGIQLIDTDGRLIYPGETGMYVNADGTWRYTESSLTLYAHWASADTIITLNPGEGEEQTVKAYNNLTEGFSTILNPTRIGYMFTGWYTAETGGTKVIDTDGHLEPNVSGYTNADGKWSCQELEVTFYAGWKKADTVIQLHLKGGSGDDYKVYAYTGVTSSFTITRPERTGYTFTGWYTAETGGTKVIDTGGKLVPDVSGYTDQNGIWICTEESVTLNAQWAANVYTVTYKGNGNTGGTAPTDTKKYENGEEVTVRDKGTLAKTGYTFCGWNTDEDGGGTSYEAGSKFSISASIILYAQWTVNQYTITFDSAGGSDVPSITQDYGTDVRAPANPTKAGYIFTKWLPAVPEKMPAEDLTCVAQWIESSDPVRHTVFYDLNGCTGGTAPPPQPQTREEEPLTVAAVPGGLTAPAGKVLAGGWNTAAAGTGTDYAVGASITPASDITLYVKLADITPATYTLTYNANGGTGGPADTDVTYGQQLPALAAADLPTRVGYTFDGYFDEQSGGKKYYYADGTGAKNWDKKTDTTLYAQWTANTYYVRFNKGEGTGSEMPDQTLTYDAGLTKLSKNTYTAPTGKVFAGWAKTGGGAVEFADEAEVSNLTDQKDAVVNLYAVWSDKEAKSITKGTMTGGAVTVSSDASGSPEISMAVKGTTVYLKPAAAAGYTYTANSLAAKYSDGSEQTLTLTETSAGSGVYKFTMPDFPVTVAAGFTANTYTITYKDKGDQTYSGDYESALVKTHAYGTDTILIPGTKTGYAFDGWFDNSACSGTPVSTLGAAAYTADITLYAVWKAEETRITPRADGHADIEIKPVPKYPENPVEIASAENVRTMTVTPAADVDDPVSSAGFRLDKIYTLYQMTATPADSGKPVMITIKIQLSAGEKPENIYLKHYNERAGMWDSGYIAPGKTPVFQGGWREFVFPVTEFSPFAVVSGTPVKTSSGSSAPQGSSTWLTEPAAETQPTGTPTPGAVETPSVKPVDNPSDSSAKTPTPFVGILAGLGAAAAVFGLRQRR